MKHTLIATCAVLLAGALPLAIPPRAQAASDEIAEAEATLTKQGCKLARLKAEPASEVAVLRYTLQDPTELSGFYLRNTQQRRAKLFQQFRISTRWPAELSAYPSAIVCSTHDGSVLATIAPTTGWEAFEVVPPARMPSVTRKIVYEFEAADGFMRAKFAEDDGWKIVAGQWQLNKHGAGLPTENPASHRSVNPFSVIGSAAPGEIATLAYDTPTSHGDSYVAEARFYLGSGGDALDLAALRRPIPTFLIAQGDPSGLQVGFGWWAERPGAPARWSLCYREKTSSWTVLKSWAERPPRCTWTRVGVAVVDGHIPVAMLDGRELGRADLARMVSGSFQIHAGPEGRQVEFDDVAAGPLVSREPERGQPIYVESRNFATKALLADDPAQFNYWAKAANCFIRAWENDPKLGLTSRATARLPFYGNFTYRSTPGLANGDYRFVVLNKFDPRNANKRPEPADVVAEFAFNKSDRGWLPATGKGTPAFTLEFGRRDGKFVVKDGKKWESLGAACSGPIHLMIAPPGHFIPERHNVYSSCTWYELFEQAPTQWYWHDGMFGMNSRWACQPDWNFMAGQSGALAAFFSKAAYYGDQEFECFMSLRMTVPKELHHYIRHSLGVSFCTDGRNLDSGYSLIFGGERNTRTILLKRGKEIASTNDPRFLIPGGTSPSNVHRKWWNFHLKKAGNRIVAKLNGTTIFDVDDPDPIDGGHQAFWSVANGFVVARVNTIAEKRIERPQKALRGWTQETHYWKPLYPDAVVARETDRGIEVKNPGGGGTFAVRANTSADLSNTPILEIPLRLDPDAKVNLHIEIDGQPWLIRISAPVQEMEYLLTPAAENVPSLGRPVIRGDALDAILLAEAAPHNGLLRVDLGGHLRRKEIPIEGVRQITLTIGNSSNAGYLLAGFGGNHAGTTYCAGKPKWTKTSQQQAQP
ncbi:MAG: hypothetical protein HQ592_08870 [Planctomycetes bacterium]|nr:hypothetical protein [Planctomycetota bacterium]